MSAHHHGGWNSIRTGRSQSHQAEKPQHHRQDFLGTAPKKSSMCRRLSHFFFAWRVAKGNKNCRAECPAQNYVRGLVQICGNGVADLSTCWIKHPSGEMHHIISLVYRSCGPRDQELISYKSLCPKLNVEDPPLGTTMVGISLICGDCFG